MNKKIIFLLLALTIIIMLIPIPHTFENGKEYKALLYSITIKNTQNEQGTIIKIFGIEISNTTNNIEIKTLDEFYQNEMVKEYKDIRKLKEDYSEQEAIQDNCFVIGEEVSNDNLFSIFFDNYNNKKDAFLRTIQFTIEKDMVIYDLLFDKNTNKIYIVFDSTRDRYSDKKIELLNYEHMAQYEYLNHTYWVLYNGELTDQTLFTDNSFIVSSV